jgi:hypothetical protein
MTKELRIGIILIIIITIFLFSCKFKAKEANTIELTKEPNKEFFLRGSWIYHDKARFILIEINDTNDVIYYHYGNSKELTGKNGRNWLIKSKATLTVFKPRNSVKWLTPITMNSDDQIISISTEEVRHDYVVKKDTLIEFDKTGILGRLYRIYPEED